MLRYYRSRKEATAALKVAVAKQTGKGVGLDASRSRHKLALFRCTSAIKSAGSGKTDLAEDEDVCPFKAVLRGPSKHRTGWCFDNFTEDDDGPKYWIDHSDECVSCAKLTGEALYSVVSSSSVAANPTLPQEKVIKELCKVAGIDESMLPSSSALYRSQFGLKHASDAWYEQDWKRLEAYLVELGDLNPSWRVTLEKDNQGRFKRYFIGVGPAKNVMKACGLDVAAVDACHTCHHIVNGMKLHVLSGQSGLKKNVMLAWSLEALETADSYQWLAAECGAFGLAELFNV